MSTTAADLLAKAREFAASGKSLSVGQCLYWVRTMAGASPGVHDAAEAWANAGNKHVTGTPPAGAIVYWTGGSQGFGHVAISDGNGYIYSTDISRPGKVDRVSISDLNSKWSNLHYAGWTDNVNGVKVTGLGKVPSATAVGLVGGAASGALGGGSSTSSGGPSVTTSTISKADLAAGYASAGFGKALIGAFPELKKLYDAAIQKGYSPDRFLDSVRSSDWYRSRSDAQKKYDTLQQSNPAEFSRQVTAQRTAIIGVADKLGVVMSKDELTAFARSTLRYGLTDAEVSRSIAKLYEYKTVQTPTTKPASEFDKLVNSISGQESGGNYGARGQRTSNGDRAYGRYQIMGNNIASWTKQYLGKSLTPEQFLADKASQDKVARGVLKTYYDKYGAAGAAAAWYGGEGGAKKYLAGGNVAGQNGPMLRDYVQQVLNRMKSDKTTSTTTTTTPAVQVGDAGQLETQIRALAHDYGVPVSNDTVGKQIKDILLGKNSMQGLTSYYRAQAVSRFPQFSEQITGGQTVTDIAQPYVDTMANLLEVDPKTLDWSDKTVQKGMSMKDAKGSPTSMPLWQFEDAVRNDARWQHTDNARKSVLDVGHSLLQTFGLAV